MNRLRHISVLIDYWKSPPSIRRSTEDTSWLYVLCSFGAALFLAVIGVCAWSVFTWYRNAAATAQWLVPLGVALFISIQLWPFLRIFESLANRLAQARVRAGACGRCLYPIDNTERCPECGRVHASDKA